MVRVSGIFLDQTPGSLVGAFLDLTSGTLRLTLSEPMKVASLVPELLVIQSGASDVYTTTGVQLSRGAIPISNDGITVSYNLSSADLNAIKTNTQLGISTSTTFLKALPGFIVDMAGVNATGTPANASIDASFESDLSRPSLLSYSLTMQNGSLPVVLSLKFTESMVADQVDITEFTLLSGREPGAQSFTFTGHANKSMHDTDTIHVTLLDSDILTMRSATPNVARDANSTYLILTSKAASDMNSQDVLAILQPSALRAALFDIDMEQPSVLAFDLDLKRGFVILTMSEAIVLETVDLTQLRIQNDKNSSRASQNFSLEFSAVQSDVASKFTVEIQLDSATLDAFKTSRSTGRLENYTFLAIESSFCLDRANNSFALLDDPVVLQVQNITLDDAAPIASHVSIDMNISILSISFNEPIDIFSTNIAAQISITTAIGELAYVNLSGYSVASLYESQFSRVLHLQMTKEDSNELKRSGQIATSVLNTAVSFGNDLVMDTNNVWNLPSELQCSGFTPDFSSPKLLNWTLDEDSGILGLKFDEPAFLGFTSFNVSSGTIIFQLSEPANLNFFNASARSGPCATSNLRTRL
eukprot:m.98678 g.98678  ORF g.98678 m.98678 type:complete len:586 (+) comp16758_c0_seq2:3435-5192(+)